MAAAEHLAVDLGNARQACAALGVARATLYRRRRPRVVPQARPRPTPARALSPVERQSVLDVLHEERFADLAPPQVYAELLEEDRFLCSIRSMYRYLDAAREVKERRDIRRHPQVAEPRDDRRVPGSWRLASPIRPSRGLSTFASRFTGLEPAGQRVLAGLHTTIRFSQVEPTQGHR